jgi:hypothetical protein
MMSTSTKSLAARLERLEAIRAAPLPRRAHRIIVEGDQDEALKRYQETGAQISPEDLLIFRVIIDPVEVGRA